MNPAAGIVLTWEKMPGNLFSGIKLFTAIVLCSFAAPVVAQTNIALGSWRTHLNYSQARIATAAGKKIFCSTGHSLFFVDSSDGSVNKMTKQDGLHDLAITAIGYDHESGWLILGSGSGNLDLIRDNKVYHIGHIARSGIGVSRRINHISFHDNYAYISTDFGVPALDLEKMEVYETYMPGRNGNPLVVYGSIVLNDTLYLATAEGILAGAMGGGVNLIDFRSWKRLSVSDNLPETPFLAVAAAGETLFAATPDQLYRYGNFVWQIQDADVDDGINSLTPYDKGIILTTQTQIARIDGSGGIEYIDHELIEKPQQAVQDHSGVLWIADKGNGLLGNPSGNFISLYPAGPASNRTTQIKAAGDSLIAVSASVDQPGSGFNDGFSLFSEGSWTNFLPGKTMPAVNDLVDLTFNPVNKKIYFASIADGLIEWDGGAFKVFGPNPEQTTLKTAAVSTVAADRNGAVWMINFNQDPALHARKEDNAWQAFPVNHAPASLATTILINTNGDKWMAGGNGIIVYNEEKQQTRHLTSQEGSGNLPSTLVNGIALDLDGFIWVATGKGVVYFTDPTRALLQEPINAFTPVFEGRRLLNGVNITALAVDPANRKWIGTQEGAWLFNESADELIHHFTAANSPLLSDSILDIEINPMSGEVFFATEGGIASYREAATMASKDHSQVKIFPNPVEPGFNGLVGITGLVENAEVRITDISGNLVWKSRALGGGAAWNIRDYHGRRVSGGVYFVFSSRSDGSETFVGKIAVIN